MIYYYQYVLVYHVLLLRQFCFSLWEYPKVCVNLQTDVR